MFSVSDITKFMLEEEETLNLFGLKEDDTYIWPLLRVRVMTMIETKLGLITTPHDAQRKWNRLERYSKGLRYDMAAFKRHKGNVVIIEHPRKVNVDGEEIDIYTHELQKQFPKAIVVNRLETNNLNHKNKGLIVLQESVFDKYDKKMEERIAVTSSFYEFDILSKAIAAQFEIEIDVNALYKDAYKHFVRGEERMMRFLKKNKVEQVILVVAYANYDVVSACKKCGVKVVECQHGIIDSHHLGYHYPNGCPKECFVDELWLFAPYWRLNAALPLDDDHLKYIGFAYFHSESKKYSVERKEHVVTVLSQGTSGAAMLEQVLDLARAFPMLEINYKLHPGEFQNVEERYPALKDAPANVHVYKSEKPLYELLKESKYVVGAYSTAIYEGLALGCVGILIDVPGTREYMATLIKNDLAYVTNQLAKDFKFISSDALSEVKNIYF